MTEENSGRAKNVPLTRCSTFTVNTMHTSIIRINYASVLYTRVSLRYNIVAVILCSYKYICSMFCGTFHDLAILSHAVIGISCVIIKSLIIHPLVLHWRYAKLTKH